MKLTLIIACTLMIGLSVDTFAKEKPKHPEVHVLSRRMDCFYFKIHKEMIGAQVEVFSENGQKLTEQTLTNRKNIIDFYNENPGRYIITIKKGDVQQSFDYHKTSPSSVPLELERVVVAAL
jgi:hypothetical protein